MNRVTLACLLIASGAFAHIKPGSFSVASGTVYTVGQNVTLSWSASIDHNMSAYNLWYSTDSGKSWTTVKSGIPGKASNVLVTYQWTVPTQPTKKGMLRVFQVFGGTVATSPSNPGDYTLFSPVFEIKATSSVRERASSDAAPSLRWRGGRLEIQLDPLDRRSANLEVLGLDGSGLGSFDLVGRGDGSGIVSIGRSQLGVRDRSTILVLRIDGRPVAREIVAPVR